MKEFNISEPAEYYSQINNKRFPYSACNVTALTECLDIIDKLFDFPNGVQPEDHLMNVLRDDNSYERMERLYPWARKGGYEPNEVHAMLEWAVNLLVGEKVDTFSTTWDLRELVYELVINKHPSAISGRFTDYGHIVTLVGIETEQEDIEKSASFQGINLSQIKKFIVDDPYGDYFDGYETTQGNDLRFSFKEFNDITKTYNDTSAKWAHLIKRA